MSLINENSSLADYQRLAEKVYGVANRRHFTMDGMLTNVQRFLMRGLKGIRKGDSDKIKLNTRIALSWFMSILNQLQIDIETAVWNRFPYLCSYCGNCPCVCKPMKGDRITNLRIDESLRPKTFRGFQKMFAEIYPQTSHTLEHSGLHLAEELGEFSEAFLKFRSTHTDADFNEIVIEGADLISCFMGLFNSLNFDISKELEVSFKDGCPSCHSVPCKCEYNFVMNFKS